LSASSTIDDFQPAAQGSKSVDQTGQPPATPGDAPAKRPAAAPDDEYWSRPTE
jgi:hypothetical protein